MTENKEYSLERQTDTNSHEDKKSHINHSHNVADLRDINRYYFVDTIKLL